MALVRINDKLIEFSYNEKNLKIKNSYKITDREEMKKILEALRLKIKRESGICYKRPVSEWIVEWEAHNLFYNLNMQRHRSQDVDLNEDEIEWKIKYGYPICAFLYRITNA